MDSVQLIELILVMVVIKTAALTYYIFKMNTRQKKVDRYLDKMDELAAKMNERLNRLETQVAAPIHEKSVKRI